jgi:UDP-N-acetylglucosamine--N-acetylmuramyl-(pentapeptide) pyrophosphoryl-undecaprenol N-acetylglucosamine transferase
VKTIVLTGGGTAGHVIPNIALMPELIKAEWDIHYIGSENGIEYNLLSKINNITYHGIKSGKLRRYLDIKNFTDPFNVMLGTMQSIKIIRQLKPSIVFSKGGFVSVPVVISSWLNNIPVVIHESDISPGLANKIATRFASKVCTTFPETVSHFKKGKALYTGTPIRSELLKGSPTMGKRLCGFNENKPVIMVMGGSLGAVAINKSIRALVNKLTTRFQIVHICGKKNTDENYNNIKGYRQFEYISEELPHIMALADIIISRAGANSIFEFLTLRKPNILIPLPLESSRGDQILNARSFEKHGYSKVLQQNELNADTLYLAILDVYNNRHKYIDSMSKQNSTNSNDKVLEIIKKYSK